MTTQLLSVAKAAARLDCSRGHIYNLIAARKLRAVEIRATGTRTKTRIREEDLEAFIEAQTREAPSRHWIGGGGAEVRRSDGT